MAFAKNGHWYAGRVFLAESEDNQPSMTVLVEIPYDAVKSW